MHGLINRSIQCFLRDAFGPDVWEDVARASGMAGRDFEAMLHYDDILTSRVLGAAMMRLCRTRESLLEDLGTYLVSHPGMSSVRRLLRFGGGSFMDFLYSLEELPDRGRLALPDLGLPSLQIEQAHPGRFVLTCRHKQAGYGHVMLGILRAMADDYGALVVLDHRVEPNRDETIVIDLLESSFAAGRDFELATS